MSKDSDGRFKNMLRRRVTGICLAVVLVAMWIFQGWFLRLGFMLFMGMSIWEMQDAFKHRGARPVRWVGVASPLIAMPLYLIYGEGAIAPLTALLCILGLAFVILRGEVDFDSAVATLFPLIYPGLLFTLIFPLQDLKPQLFATVALGMSFLVALMNDLFAYEIGMRFGKRPLASVLSPKKTVEGAVAGVLASVAFAVLIPLTAEWVCRVIPAARPYAAELPPLWHFAIVGLLGGLAAPVGDLTASMVKRYCGIKDYGAIFPGHGGMLDRMDSVIFAGAVVYIYFRLVLRVM